VLSHAKEYRIPLLDIEQHAKLRGLSILGLADDRVYANDRGHALIREVLFGYLRRNRTTAQLLVAANRTQQEREGSLDGIQFVPAHKLLAQQVPIPLQHFNGLGSGISCIEGCDLSFSVDARLVVVVFQPSDKPIKFSYRLDGKEWSPTIEQPSWLISYPLLSEGYTSTHRIELKSGKSIAGFLIQ
jgi:hypothetical protein